MRPVDPKEAQVKSETYSVPVNIFRCAYVYVQIDGMADQYEGPYKVLCRRRNTFLLDKAGIPFSVHVVRLKPAILD